MIFDTGNTQISTDINKLTVAGWTARDKQAIQEHIDELAELGVKPPSSVPLYYSASPLLLTQKCHIDVLGGYSSGEIEPVVIQADNQLWLGIGSDHTDRDLEAFSVAHSKQVCPKPISCELWAFDEVEPHLDKLQLRSWIDEGSGWVLYQQGDLSMITPLQTLIDEVNLVENSALFCGTLPAIGEVRTSSRFKMALFDPVLDRTIEHQYLLTTLPIVN